MHARAAPAGDRDTARLPRATPGLLRHRAAPGTVLRLPGLLAGPGRGGRGRDGGRPAGGRPGDRRRTGGGLRRRVGPVPR
ncbi:hypothetical protein EF879_01245 [Micromonospora sp. HM5-17]|nr:hypothetical protein EF879_01245 [Micromonospora sp. HM5-17]